jgi:LacI family transcriptional regulator
LQNSPLVKKETREKVQRLAKKLNYRPNILARSMRTKESKTIGVVVPNIESEFFAKVISGIEKTAYKSEYNIIIYQTGEDFKKEEKVVDMLLSLQIVGLIACFSESNKVPEYIKTLGNEGVECVLFDRVSKEDDLDTNKVITNNYEVFYEVTEYLLQRGKSKIGFFSGSQGIHAFEDRIRAYKDALIQNGMSIDKSMIQRNVLTKSDIEKSIDYLSDKNIDSLIITNERTTVETILFLTENGYNIPKEILPIGAENHIIATLINPTIPMIRYNGFKMGVESANLLINSINNDKSGSGFKTKIIDAKLIV